MRPPVAVPIPAVFNGTSGALILAVASTAIFATMHALVRHVSGTLHPFEIAFFRSIFGLAAVAPLMWRVGPSVFVSRNPRLLAVRGVVGGLSLMTWFYGLSIVPIATATALSFTSVIFASIGAAVFLKERMRLRRWTAVVLGFVGVLVIVRPGLTVFDPGSLVIVLAAILWGVGIVLVKTIARTDETVTIVAWSALWLIVATAIPAWLVWITPTWTQLAWLIVIGVFGTVGTFAWTQALKTADASLVIPTDFTRLVWAGAIGFAAFGEIPDRWMWVGAALIIGSTLYIGLRESKLAREGKLTPGSGSKDSDPDAK
ncbi:MAG: DMT family transporter [Gammaproteobacteria bacterium]|nr:DMT family transporter [Gammaproteobacteria bacterium]